MIPKRKKARTLESQILVPVIGVMILLTAFIVVDIFFLQRTLKINKALSLAESIPGRLELVAFYEDRYLDSHKDYVLGQFATSLNDLSVTYQTLVDSSGNNKIKTLGEKTIEDITHYQGQVFKLTDKFLAVSKDIERYERAVERGIFSLSKSVDEIMTVRMQKISKAAQSEGLRHLVQLWWVAQRENKKQEDSDWERLLKFSDAFDVWAENYGDPAIRMEGQKVAQAVGTILEQKNMVRILTKELAALSIQISNYHGEFLTNIQTSMEFGTALLTEQQKRNKNFVIIDLTISICLIIFMLWTTIKTIRTRLSFPINRMIATMEKIGHGSLEDRVPIPEGRELAALARTFNDMTDALYDSRQNLVNQRDNLEIAVEKRTAELKKLNDELLRSNKELDDFTYIVSHDLKEPLRGVATFARFLQEEFKDVLMGEGIEYLEIITNSATRMKRLIEDLLEISRISRTPYQAKEFSLLKTLLEIREDLDLMISERNADLILPMEDVNLTADEVRIKQVFTNLINNGLKFNDSNNPTAEVVFHWGMVPDCPVNVVVPSEYITIEVRDNGIGIEKKHFSKVFGIFQRLVSREDYEGTGAGLTICKRIVEDHGGVIWLDSEVGMGTTFFVVLPLVSPEKETYTLEELPENTG